MTETHSNNNNSKTQYDIVQNDIVQTMLIFWLTLLRASI